MKRENNTITSIFAVFLLGLSLTVFSPVGCVSDDDDDDNNDTTVADDDDDNDDTTVTDDDDDDSTAEYNCTVEYCDDVINFCEFSVSVGCGGWDDNTVQECIDGAISGFNYCGYPANIASCLGDCALESSSCSEMDTCEEDHECSWFGDCP